MRENSLHGTKNIFLWWRSCCRYRSCDWQVQIFIYFFWLIFKPNVPEISFRQVPAGSHVAWIGIVPSTHAKFDFWIVFSFSCYTFLSDHFFCPLYHLSCCACILTNRAFLSDMLSSQLQLHWYATGRYCTLKPHLFRFIYFFNHISCSLLGLLAWFQFKLFSFPIFSNFFPQLPRLCQHCVGS